MTISNFTEEELEGQSEEFSRLVVDIRARFGFDFVSLGLTPYVGAPLKWVYSDGATSERHRRILLAPGHGIGGIVVKAGKPMMFTDIDKEIDPREYSSYPIVFAEDLRSFCALPLVGGGRTVAVLLCAFRSVEPGQRESFAALVDYLGGFVCGLEVVSEDFLNFEGFADDRTVDAYGDSPRARSDTARIIEGQEDERRRISRELHDSVGQELLAVSISLRGIDKRLSGEAKEVVEQAVVSLDRILDELHDISVTLRPASLDNLGLLSALRTQALLMQNSYGVKTTIDGTLSNKRFDPAVETQVYRICQEAMLNSCKYSGSDSLYVNLEDSGGWLHVSIVDHGVGFNTESPVIRGSGCGLSGMRERAALIGAVLTTESGPSGTTVTLVAPMGDIPDKGGVDD